MVIDKACVEYGSDHTTGYAFAAEIAESGLVIEAMLKRKPSQAL